MIRGKIGLVLSFDKSMNRPSLKLSHGKLVLMVQTRAEFLLDFHDNG
jgi:hypothetical protein